MNRLQNLRYLQAALLATELSATMIWRYCYSDTALTARS